MTSAGMIEEPPDGDNRLIWKDYFVQWDGNFLLWIPVAPDNHLTWMDNPLLWEGSYLTWYSI